MDILHKITHEMRLERPCLRCGRMFPSTHLARSYCTIACSRKAARLRAKKREQAEELNRAAGQLSAPPAPNQEVTPEARSYAEPPLELNLTPAPDIYEQMLRRDK